MKLNLRKYDTVEIEGVTFPVRTLSLAEEVSIFIKPNTKFPVKIQTLTEADKQELIQVDGQYNPKIYVATKVIDKSSTQYLEYLEEKEKYTKILETAKFIDFNRKMEDGKPFYTQLDLPDSKDWLAICKALDEAGYGSNHAELILLKIKSIKKESIFERFFNLKAITDMDEDDLLYALEEIILNKQIKQEEYLQELEDNE